MLIELDYTSKKGFKGKPKAKKNSGKKTTIIKYYSYRKIGYIAKEY